MTDVYKAFRLGTSLISTLPYSVFQPVRAVLFPGFINLHMHGLQCFPFWFTDLLQVDYELLPASEGAHAAGKAISINKALGFNLQKHGR